MRERTHYYYYVIVAELNRSKKLQIYDSLRQLEFEWTFNQMLFEWFGEGEKTTV